MERLGGQDLARVGWGVAVHVLEEMLMHGSPVDEQKNTDANHAATVSVGQDSSLLAGARTHQQVKASCT